MMHLIYEDAETIEEVLSPTKIYSCTCGWAGARSDLLFGKHGRLICPRDTIISRHNHGPDSDEWEEYV